MRRGTWPRRVARRLFAPATDRSCVPLAVIVGCRSDPWNGMNASTSAPSPSRPAGMLQPFSPDNHLRPAFELRLPISSEVAGLTSWLTRAFYNGESRSGSVHYDGAIEHALQHRGVEISHGRLSHVRAWQLVLDKAFDCLCRMMQVQTTPRCLRSSWSTLLEQVRPRACCRTRSPTVSAQYRRGEGGGGGGRAALSTP